MVIDQNKTKDSQLKRKALIVQKKSGTDGGLSEP